MRALSCLFFVSASLIACGLASAAEDKTAAADKPDAERILGTWILDSTERKIDLFQGDGQTVKLTFEADAFRFAVEKDGGKTLDLSGSYFIDPAQTPKLFDVTIRGGDGSNTVFAIYEFKDDKLRVRLRDNNGPRPAGFEPADDCQTLTFKRDEAAK